MKPFAVPRARFIRSALICVSALVLVLGGCAEPELLSLRVSQLRLEDGTRYATSDPSAKNRALRRTGTFYDGMVPGLSLPAEQLLRLRRDRLGGTGGDIEVLSMDEGIVLHRSDTRDGAPVPLRRPEGFELYWASGRGTEEAIWRAHSEDGYLWTAASQVLGPSAQAQDEAHDRLSVGDPAVVRLFETWFLYYTGSAEAGADGRPIDNEVFCARSGDNGATWIKHGVSGAPPHPTAVIHVAERDGGYGVGAPSVVYKDGLVYLWYTDRRPGAGGLFLALSEDGLTFRSHRQVAPDIQNADIKYCPALDLFVMVYGEVNDERIYWNISSDGITWHPHNPERTVATGPPETIHHSPSLMADDQGYMEPVTRVFYTGGAAQPGTLGRSTWEIESSWICVRRMDES